MNKGEKNNHPKDPPANERFNNEKITLNGMVIKKN